MCIAGRKRVALKARLASLDYEFDGWKAISAANGPLEKHNSQIRRLTDQLTSCRDQIAAELDGLADDARLLSDAIYVEEKVLEVHRLWAYFRTKLELRMVAWYKDPLRAADEFAWRCYQPVQQAADAKVVKPADVKEPPLVYLTGGWSPLLLSRGKDFLLEREPTVRLIAPASFFDLTRRLPIPLVGLPWSQLSQAFDGAVLGHEVGHAVQDDFQLTDDLTATIRTAVTDPKRLPAWEAWLREVFADWYGCLATGPAFVGTMIDMLVRDKDDPLANRKPPGGEWGSYPSPVLRVGLNLQFLRTLDFGAEADALAKVWGPVPDHPMKEFEKDLGAVARALFEVPLKSLGNKTLPGVFRFLPKHQAAAVAVSKVLDKPAALPVADEAVRVLFAAGRLAFEAAPQAFVDKRLQTKLTDAVCQKIPRGLRAGPGDPKAKAAADRRHGEDLFAAMTASP
jgi:hypothetical protein